MKNLLPILLLALTACHSRRDKPVVDSAAVYKVPDDKAITKAVHDAYASISFKKGAEPLYDAIKNCFIPQAQLINYSTDTAQVTNIGQFIYLYRTFIEGDSIKLFCEQETYGKTEQFGRIAERISTYKNYVNTMDKLAETGVNSFQLIKTNDGWKVSSIIWDIERKGLKIPPYYTGK